MPVYEELRPRMRTAADPDPFGAADRSEPALLLRIPAPDDRWLDRLPPVPEGAAITVSLTDPTAAIRHAARLLDLGYLPVGSAATGTDRGWADLVVPRAVLDEDPSWRLRLTVEGTRVLDPALGPVRRLFGAVLAAHARDGGEG